MEGKHIVIVGAGYAGVHAAKKLAKKYKKDDSVTITLIDRHSYHTMMTELHEVAAHRVEPEAVQLDLRRLFNRTKVKLVTDTVKQVDHDQKYVITENGSFPFDYLILGMGGEPNSFGTTGAEEHAFTLWSLEDAVKLRKHIETMVRQAAHIRDKAKRRAMLTFTVCGSGFTGIEMAGELIEWKERLAKDNKLDENEITLYIVEATSSILNMLDRKVANKAEAYLVKKGVEILKKSPIVEVKPDFVRLKSGEIIPTHTLIWTAGVQANSDTKEFGMESARTGRLKVNSHMEAEGMKDVYVVGDLAYYEEEPETPTPQIVEAAEQTTATAVNNIAADIEGKEKEDYKGNYHGIMVSIGARYGVADLNGIHVSGWLSNLVKHMVNLFYFFTLRSGYYMFQYIKHEFFHSKDRRNIFRGFPSRLGNVLWSLPLRIFVAGFWLVEAFQKIWGYEKWEEATSSLTSLPQLLTGFGNDSWVTTNQVNMPFEWLQTDATTGATDAGEWASPIFNDMPFFMEWIMRITVPTPEMAVFMQKFMLIVELGIGFAILFGLFTWLASAGSAALIVMFTMTAMLGWGQLWVLPASIALMNGSGRTFGLDYWVVPYLQRKAGDFWYGKQRSVYNDYGNGDGSVSEETKQVS